jgi:glycosyltransferase involved in cell wall biosynthesis
LSRYDAKVRILFVTQIVPFPPHGGVLQRGYNLLRELGKRHEVHLLAFHHPDELPPGEPVERSRAELGKYCRTIEYFPLWPKVSALHKLAALGLGAIYPGPFSVLAHKSRAMAKRITSLCAARVCDIVHLDTIALAPYLENCGVIPTVLCHHNIESRLMARRAEHETSFAARKYVASQSRKLLEYEREQPARFRLNITVSANDSDTLRRICPGVHAVDIPNGVDTEYFAPRPHDGAPTLIYTGGMNMFANRDAIEWFLDAIWPRVKAAIPQVRFLGVGARPCARLLEAAAADRSIEAPGFVDDVRPWVARAAVYVVPLRVGGGTRLKMVDAMAQGKAIVATSIGAEGTEGDDGTHFMLRDDAKSFADTLIELLHDPERRTALGAAARQRAVDRYSWPMLAERLAGHYERVVGAAAA